MTMIQYKIEVKEIDGQTNYPVDVLAGLTGLGTDTIRRLERDGCFRFTKDANGNDAVNGKQFLDWAGTVDHTIEVKASH